jgi:energy-coupling factor transporter ATP-binding protein EcfA2
MKVTSLTVKDVLGIQELSIEVGKVTTISGRNATGKSSLLGAIKATLGRGALGRLARIGTDEDPETVLVLDDGKYRVERSAKKTKVKKQVGGSAAYEDVPRGQSFLDSLVDADLQNPVSFLTAKPADRVDLLLEALPLEIDWEALPKELGCWPAGMEVAAVADLHPLIGLAIVREGLYDERTGVNRSQKDKASSAYELKKSVPAEPTVAPEEAIAGVEANLSGLRSSLSGMEAAQEAREATSRAVFKAEAAKLRKASEAAQAELRAACERECQALERQAGAKVDQARTLADEGLDRAASEHLAATADLLAKITGESGSLATLREQSKRSVQDAESRRLADKFEAESDELKLAADLLTQGIENLDDARRALAKNLPIEGLEVRGKEIYLDDIPFTTLNTAERIKLAVQIATLRAKSQKLPVLFVDGAEALDRDQFKILVRELKKSSAQVFLARVEQGDLKVEVEAS